MRWQSLTLGFVLLAACMSVAQADQPQYMAVFMDDVKVGHTVSQRKVEGGEVTHRLEMTLTLGRGSAEITIAVVTETIETTDGKPLAFSMTTRSLLGNNTKSGVIDNGKIKLAAGTSGKRTVNYPKGALMTEGIARLMKAKGDKAGTKYTYTTFDPESLGGLTTDVVVGKRTRVPLIERVAAGLTPIAATVHHGTGKLTTQLYVDKEFEAKKMEMAIMGIKLSLVACGKKYALSANGKFDALNAGTVASPTPIANARNLRRATYTLTPNAKDITFDLPTSDSQTVRVGADGVVTVQVATVAPGKAPLPYAGQDADALTALKPGQYVESGHATIRKQAREIVAGKTNSADAAKAIVAWVHAHITTKDLSVGYATALTTLKSRKGDCTEHSVLTAALCRAAGIPCRIVAGVAYVAASGELRNRFAGHQWNQVFIDGKWIDIDAALGTDAARIILVLGAEDQTDFIAMANSLGSFKITKVVIGR